MDMFSSYRLVKVEDGYDLELYIDNPAMNDVEFAEEFNRIDPENRQRLNRNILDYIGEKFPGIKIRMVKVMVDPCFWPHSSILLPSRPERPHMLTPKLKLPRVHGRRATTTIQPKSV